MLRAPTRHRLLRAIPIVVMWHVTLSCPAEEPVEPYRISVSATFSATSNSTTVLAEGSSATGLPPMASFPVTGILSGPAIQPWPSSGLSIGSSTSQQTEILAGSNTLQLTQDVEPSESVAPRLADDLPSHSTQYTRVLADINGDGVIQPDETIAIISSYGDLHTSHVWLDHLSIQESRRLRSIEVTKQLVFAEDSRPGVWHRGWRVDAYDQSWSVGIGDEVVGRTPLARELEPGLSDGMLRRFLNEMRWSTYGTLGLRVLEVEDRFLFQGISSILGRAEVETIADHDVIGPQLGLGVVAESGIWRFEAVALGLVGYGRFEFGQRGISPSTLAAYSHHGEADDYVAWHGETRLAAGCQITQQLRFDASWRWYATTDVHSATLATAWDTPEFGLAPTNGQTEQADDWFFGLTYVH